MTENFNNFFTFIGKNHQKTIPLTRKDYAQKPKQKNYSIKPAKPEEICDIIKALKIVKVQAPITILHKFLRQLKNRSQFFCPH